MSTLRHGAPFLPEQVGELHFDEPGVFDLMVSRLSKSRFISGQQCPLRLWFDLNRRDRATLPDDAQRSIFEIGHEVGDLARARWPGGTLVGGEPWEVAKAAGRTDELLRDPSVPAISEAAVIHHNVLTRVDVLVRNGADAWDLIEVKAGTRSKEPFETDVALQYWILRGAGLPVRRAGLLVLNRDYVYRGGEYDLETLFRFVDLTDQCEERVGEIAGEVERLQEVAAAEHPPAIDVGPHCHSPYPCPYWAHCTRDLSFPEHPIDRLPNLREPTREALAARGVERIEDIPADFRLSWLQERVRWCVSSGAEWVSGELEAVLNDVTWPLHFLDFEAVAMALPRYPGTRPWDAISFQFSCHHQHDFAGDVTHSEFLATEINDPRRPLAEALLSALGRTGSIVVYSGYEKQTIRRLAEALPDLRDELLSLEHRLVDLLAVVRSHYCHPGFGGSFSIKDVLPVLVPHMSYSGLEIADGQAAGRAWNRMLVSEDAAEREQLESALRVYCAQDSLAMFELREALLVRCGAGHGSASGANAAGRKFDA